MSRGTGIRVACLLQRIVQSARGYSESLHARDHHVPLSPVILIDTVLVDVEPVRGVHETG